MKIKKVLTLLFIVSLLVGCGGMGPKAPTVEEEAAKISIDVNQISQIYIGVKFSYSGERDISSWNVYLYDTADDSLVEKTQNLPSDTTGHGFVDLMMNHEYKVKVIAQFWDEPYNVEVSKNVKTAEFVAPEIKGEFTSSLKNSYSTVIENSVEIYWEEYTSLIDKIELLRSDSKDGEYTVITSDTSGILKSIYDKTAEPNTTYFYKVRFYALNNGEYKFAAESKILEFTTGDQLPSAIDKKDIAVKRGITTLKYSWPEVDGAVKYNITLGTSSYSHDKDEKFETAENSYLFKGLKPDSNYYFTISVTTSAGTSQVTEASQASTGKTKLSYNLINVEPSQTQASYSVSLPFSDTTDCTVSFVLRENSLETSNVLMEIPELVNGGFMRTGLQPATWYSSYSSNVAGSLHMSVTYTDENGQTVTDTSYCDAPSFTTDNLNPPKNLKIDSVTKTTVTLSFDELTQEEKLNKTPKYSIVVYDSNGDFYKSKQEATSPVTITELKPGAEYTFKAETTFAGASSSAKQETTDITANTASGISQKPVITLKEVPFEEETLKNVWSNVQVEWDALPAEAGLDPAKLVYGIEYRIFEYSKYKRPQNAAQKDITYTGTGSFTKTIEYVNGGNRYTVRVYAYDSDEPDDIVYSEPVKIQLAAIPDNNMYAAITYPADFAAKIGATAGDVVDFSNNKVWEGEHSIRSVEGAFNFGFIQLLGQIDSTKFLFPSRDGLAFCSFKFNLSDALDNATAIPRIMIMDRSGFSFQESDYGYIDTVYFIVPNEDGTIVKKYEDSEDNLYKTFNMPFVMNGSTSAKPKDTGIPIDESFIFNNSVYMGVKQTIAGNIAFSYYY